MEYSESKGSPITLLNQLIHTDDFKHKASVLQAQPPGHQGSASKRPLLASSSQLFKGAGSPSSKATSMSSLLGPPAKRPKSSIQVFRLSSGELLTLPHSRSSLDSSQQGSLVGRGLNPQLKGSGVDPGHPQSTLSKMPMDA